MADPGPGRGAAARIHLRRPGAAGIEAALDGAGRPFTYPEVGATRDVGGPLPASLAGRYDLDRHVFPLGRGRERFLRAREALATWRHFDVPWLELHGGGRPVRTGQVVATLVRVAGLWLLNPCRVVWAALGPEDGDAAAFAYGTLPGHAECGEERFAVSYDPVAERVTYEIAAFSRPARWAVRLAYPVARRIQLRFARASAEALARAL